MTHTDLIHTPRLLIHPTTEADLPDLMSWWNDPAVMTSVGFPNGLGIDTAEMKAWYGRWVEQKDPTRRHFIMTNAGEGEPIGEIFYHHLDMDQQVARVGVKVGVPRYWGQGLAKEAMLGLIRHLFTHFPLNEVRLDVRATNQSALRLYQRVGFEEDSPPGSAEIEMKLSRARFEALWDEPGSGI